MRSGSVFLVVTVVAVAFGCGNNDGSVGIGVTGGSDASTGIDAGGTGGRGGTSAMDGGLAGGGEGGTGSAEDASIDATKSDPVRNAGGDDDAGGECEGLLFLPEPKQVAVMLLQDMSYSMTQMMGDQSKWFHAKKAITVLLTDPAYQSLGIRFGFDYFPDTAVNIDQVTGNPVYGCGVDDAVAVDIAIDTESLIIDRMNTLEPNGATPLYCALNKFTDPN